MIKAAVTGVTGYTGLELVRILLSHPGVELTSLVSNSRPGEAISDLFPSLAGFAGLETEPFDAARLAGQADVVFTALPHGASMDTVKELAEKGLKVIDLSADFRFHDLSLYEAWYGAHGAPELAADAVYGLTELNREKIKTASLVGNPGCYPTSVILPLAPLLAGGVVDPASIVVHSISGVSGAGRGASQANLFCEVSEGMKAYKIGEHRHTPEIEEQLGFIAGEKIRLSFTPHLAPLSRGILSTLTLSMKKELSTDGALSLISEYYEDSPFIRVCREGSYPDTAHVRGSNFCAVGAKVDERTGRLVVVSAIDNLVKGAAGQAVQNMNVMFGLKENEGLNHIPLSL